MYEIINSYSGGLSMWRPSILKSIFTETVSLNRLHIFSLLSKFSYIAENLLDFNR